MVDKKYNHPIGRKNATYIPLIVLAFWEVICYLPPIKGTRKLHWAKFQLRTLPSCQNCWWLVGFLFPHPIWKRWEASRQKRLIYPSFRCQFLGAKTSTLQGTNMSTKKWHFWVDDFPFPKVGYLSSLEGTKKESKQTSLDCIFVPLKSHHLGLEFGISRWFSIFLLDKSLILPTYPKLPLSTHPHQRKKNPETYNCWWNTSFWAHLPRGIFRGWDLPELPTAPSCHIHFHRPIVGPKSLVLQHFLPCSKKNWHVIPATNVLGGSSHLISG